MSESTNDAERVDGDSSEESNEPDVTASSRTVAADDSRGRLVQWLVWLIRNGHFLAGAVIFFGSAAVLLFGIELPRSVKIIGGTALLAAILIGRPTGVKAVELMGGPELMWLVDVDLLDRDGAGVYSCPTPRWNDEWKVTKDSLWWATPNLAFGKNVDLQERTVEGTWPGSLPEPVLMRALVFLQYNRNQLENKAKRGEAIEMNAFAMIRSAVMRTTRSVVRTFEEGTLPDDGVAFREEVDQVLAEYNLEETDLFEETDDYGLDLDGDDSPSFDFTATTPSEAVNADD
ncbi:hypothetical protein [Salinigranum halophilum]|uniref:hypothetical protein n=1 Tax=Salinigranum halophilum TaxID=2565931 RepID=UPI00115DDA9A|nr:hypothetical protein [Salinigranum halophilum]